MIFHDENVTASSPVATPGGGLPVYETLSDLINAYDGDDAINVIFPGAITAAAKTFVEGFPGTVLYAIKANPHPFVLQTLWNAGVEAFDVASIREAELISAMFPAARIYFMHPVKSRATIRTAYRLGIRDFAFDCAEELDKIRIETGHASDIRLHLRIDIADLTKDGSAMPLAGKFGACEDEAPALLRAARKVCARLGVSFHVGSQCLEPEAYTTAIAYVRTLIDRSGVGIDSLDVGGGFPVSYPGMVAQPPRFYFEAIARAVVKHGFSDLAILGEPGRALVAAGGATLARIELRKGRDVYLNEGTYGSLFDAGSCGWRYPVTLHRRSDDRTDTETRIPMTAFRFFGPTCDSLDKMDGPFMLPDCAAEGDWIEIANLGAYGQTLATRFNGFFSEQTVIVNDRRVVSSGSPQSGPRAGSETLTETIEQESEHV